MGYYLNKTCLFTIHVMVDKSVKNAVIGICQTDKVVPEVHKSLIIFVNRMIVEHVIEKIQV